VKQKAEAFAASAVSVRSQGSTGGDCSNVHGGCIDRDAHGRYLVHRSDIRIGAVDCCIRADVGVGDDCIHAGDVVVPPPPEPTGVARHTLAVDKDRHKPAVRNKQAPGG
jgi:hypothetical protein